VHKETESTDGHLL